MEQNFQIAIPSYQRVKKLQNQTLTYLRSQSIDWSKVTIFLKDEEELLSYSKDLSGLRLVVCNTKSLAEKRSFIRRYYPANEPILSMDDDIKNLLFLNPDLELVPFVNRMFALCKQEGATLWGIYPTYATNMFYNKERVAIGLQFINGCFYGFLNDPTIQYPTELFQSGQEDVWLSLYLYNRDKVVLRYEGASPYTWNFGEGGLTEARKKYGSEIETSYRYLAEKFSSYCSFKIKKNGRPDVQFKKTKRRFISLF